MNSLNIITKLSYIIYYKIYTGILSNNHEDYTVCLDGSLCD